MKIKILQINGRQFSLKAKNSMVGNFWSCWQQILCQCENPKIYLLWILSKTLQIRIETEVNFEILKFEKFVSRKKYFIFIIALPPGSHQSKDWTPGFVKSTTSKSGMNTKGGSRDRYVNFSWFLYTKYKAKTTKPYP